MKIMRYALITGSVRNEFESTCIILRLIKARNDGLIDKIVLSTWSSILNDMPSYVQWLDNNGVCIVVQDYRDSTDCSSSSSYEFQAKLLQFGLDYINQQGGGFVLKCRTDLSLSMTNYFIDNIDKVDLSIHSQNRYNSHFKYKIMISKLSISMPFVGPDVVFYGYHEDLLKMINYENTIIKFGKNIMPDMWFFVCPFVHLTEFDILLKSINFENFEKVMMKIYTSDSSTTNVDSSLIKLFLIYFLVIDSCYIIRDESVTPIDFEVEDLFFKGPMNDRLIFKGWKLFICNSDLISAIISKNVIKSRMFYIMSELIDNFKNNNLTLTNKDICSIDEWSIKNFSISIKKMPPFQLACDSDYHCALDDKKSYLFNILTGDNIIEDVDTFIHSKKYYEDVSNYCTKYRLSHPQLYDTEQCGEPIFYYMCLCTAARDIYSVDFRVTSYLLFKRKLPVQLIEVAKFPFKRYSKNGLGKLFSFPTSSDRLVGVYYFSLYALDSDDSSIKCFPTYLSRFFQINYNIIVEPFNLPTIDVILKNYYDLFKIHRELLSLYLVTTHKFEIDIEEFLQRSDYMESLIKFYHHIDYNSFEQYILSINDKVKVLIILLRVERKYGSLNLTFTTNDYYLKNREDFNYNEVDGDDLLFIAGEMQSGDVLNKNLEAAKDILQCKIDDINCSMMLVDILLEMNSDNDSLLIDIYDRYKQEENASMYFKLYKISKIKPQIVSREDGLTLLKKAMILNHRYSSEYLNALWDYGSEESLKEAMNLIPSLIQANNGYAYEKMGIAYRYGKCGFVPNYEESAKYFRLAIQYGVQWANIELFDLLIVMDTQESRREAFALIEKYSKTGNSSAKARLSECYRFGIGTKRDLIKAEEILLTIHDVTNTQYNSNLQAIRKEIMQSGMNSVHNERFFGISDCAGCFR